MRPVVRAISVLLLLAAVAGCGTSGPSVPGSPPAPGSPALASPTAGPGESATSPQPSLASGSTGVVHDTSLLALLPDAIDGVSVNEEPESLAEAVGDPDFVANVAAAAFPLAVDGADLTSGVVARLRPGVFSEGFFRVWRDTYNRGACDQAGGVTGNAEAQLGGRTTYITSCGGGLLVYHAYLEGRGVIVSLFSLGDRRFGEQIMKGLRP